MMESMEEYRKFLKTDGWGKAAKEIPDQQRGVAHPPVQKPFDENAKLIELVKPDEFNVGGMSIRETAADLSVICALVSSYKNFVVPKDLIIIGEVDHTYHVNGLGRQYANQRTILH